MLRQFLFGGAVSVVNIAIHALVMTLVVRIAQRASDRAKYASRPSMLLVKVTVPTVVALMVAHTIEVVVWAVSYSLVGATPADADRVYFAFVVGVWRHRPGSALEAAWPDDGNERRAAVRVVDRADLRSLAAHHRSGPQRA